MKTIYNGAVVELKKIFGHKKYLVLLILQIIIFGLSSINTGVATSTKIMAASTKLYFINYLVIPLMVFMLAADVFPQEFNDLSIKNVMLRPISRFKIFVSKILAIIDFMFINLGLLGITVTLVGRAFSLKVIALYLANILPCLAFAALGIFIALIFKTSTLSMFISIVVYLSMILLQLYNTTMGAMLFTSQLGFYKEIGAASNQILMFISWFLFLSVINLTIFERKDI